MAILVSATLDPPLWISLNFSDEIIYHFQSIKKDLFVESFASELEANLIKDFLLFDPGKICLFCLLIVFLKASHCF